MWSHKNLRCAHLRENNKYSLLQLHQSFEDCIGYSSNSVKSDCIVAVLLTWIFRDGFSVLPLPSYFPSALVQLHSAILTHSDHWDTYKIKHQFLISLSTCAAESVLEMTLLHLFLQKTPRTQCYLFKCQGEFCINQARDQQTLSKRKGTQKK